MNEHDFENELLKLKPTVPASLAKSLQLHPAATVRTIEYVVARRRQRLALLAGLSIGLCCGVLLGVGVMEFLGVTPNPKQEPVAVVSTEQPKKKQEIREKQRQNVVLVNKDDELLISKLNDRSMVARRLDDVLTSCSSWSPAPLPTQRWKIDKELF